MNIIIVAMITDGYAEWHVRWIFESPVLVGDPLGIHGLWSPNPRVDDEPKKKAKKDDP
jgi:hypothetical protein